MKTHIITFVFSTIFLIACSSPKPLLVTETDPVVDQEASIKGGEVTIRLYTKDKSDTVQSSIEYMFYADAKLPYHDSVNKIIKQYVQGYTSYGGGMTEQNSDLSVEYIEEALDEFGAEYNRQLALYDDDDDFAGGIWSTESLLEIIDENPEYVEVSFGNWSYSGGAHGNGISEQRIIEKKTGRELKLADFFSNLDVFTSRAEAIFRADQEIQEGESLTDAGFWFEDGLFALNENFVITDESISFLFNQYEIAPYSAGVIILEIPLDQIKDLRIK